ncbi:MAG: hypothetical protein NZZ60_05180 [Bacteroidia bacterium]|nr:hypothetical protein [Bacteroidia bacterium]MCX7652157.1 hypothetical protein [Bacteroidia bacterium]MDW8416894.1 hypothetical protein [Bacteroidia bacterium]
MRFLLYILLGIASLRPAYSVVSTNNVQVVELTSAEPVKRKSFWHRLKEKAQRYWQTLSEKLRTAADDLVRLLIIALIIALAVSIVVWFLPWPLDVLIATLALVILLIFLLRYI